MHTLSFPGEGIELFNSGDAGEREVLNMICFTIDELSPCLKSTITGDFVETEVITIRRKSFLSKFNIRTNWYTDWSAFDKDTVIKAVVIKGTVDIQGLIAMKDDPDSKAVHILWAVTSPNNNVWEFGTKEYSGVGGHLFAIAGKYSVELGYGGFVYGEAMDKEIMNYYIQHFGAEEFPFGVPKHPCRIIITEHTMRSIMEEYDYEDSGEQI
jgi:hypothetical protein